MVVEAHLEGSVEGITQILCDFVDSDAPHGPHSQCPDQGVGILRVLQRQHVLPPGRTPDKASAWYVIRFELEHGTPCLKELANLRQQANI